MKSSTTKLVAAASLVFTTQTCLSSRLKASFPVSFVLAQTVSQIGIPLARPGNLPQGMEFFKADKPKDADEIRAEATKLAKLAVERMPTNANAFEVKARIHLLLGENAAAQECWETALGLTPNYIHAYYGLGKIALVRDEHERAVELLTKVVAADANYFEDAYHELAEAYHKLGEVSKAIEILKDYADSHPDSAETHLKLGHEFMADRQFEAAKNSYERTLELVPSLPRAQEGLGRALARLGEKEKARELLAAQAAARKDEIKNRPPEQVFRDELIEYAEKYKDIAKVFLAARDAGTAQAVLEKAVLMDATNVEAWSSLLGLYQRTGQLAKALAKSKDMCDGNPDNAGAFFTSGIIHAKAGDFGSAKSMLRKVIELAPESHSGYETLTRLMLQTRSELKDTVALAEKAVEVRGAAVDYELLAQTHAVNGQFDKAHQALARAIELDPKNVAFQQAMKQLDQFRSQKK